MSKELKAFEEIKKYLVNLKFHFLEEELSIVETALKRLEKIETTTPSVLREDISKKLKALEIIKKIVCITSDGFFEETIGFRTLKEEDKLTKEEYDLLKEVLL